MKLYSSTLCFGLFIVMVCQDAKPVVTRDFCQVYEEMKIRPSRKDTSETRAQIAAQKQLYEERCRDRRIGSNK